MKIELFDGNKKLVAIGYNIEDFKNNSDVYYEQDSIFPTYLECSCENRRKIQIDY